MAAPIDAGLDQALARAGDGVFVIGPDGRITLWNRFAERILGYATRDVVGQPCCDVFLGHDAIIVGNLSNGLLISWAAALARLVAPACWPMA